MKERWLLLFWILPLVPRVASADVMSDREFFDSLDLLHEGLGPVQAALETGWGRRMIQRGDGDSANNLFGIKATGWSGERASASTHEYRGGVRRNERADFRAYASPAESFADYVSLLKRSPRYAQALEAGGDVRGFAQALQRAGYATDPSYADKITAIANGPTLRKALGRITQLAQDAGQAADVPRRAAMQVARTLETLLPAGGSR